MSTDIDAGVVLGLAGKATQVFAEPGTYLSFPFAGTPFERSRLKALATDPFSHEGEAALAEFSALVNEVPDGPVWQPDGDRLWDVYGDVLAGADLAEATRTPEEEADYARAYGLLYNTQPDGSVVESSLVIRYKQYQDAYFAAAAEYNNRKSQAAVTNDAAVRDQWTIDEAVLRERLVNAEQDWQAIGRRTEVDDARRVLREIGSRSPLMAWAGYRKLFDPDTPEVFFRTAVDGSMYLPTAYFPTDVVDAAWPTITVTRDELTALAAAAPEGLRSRLAGGSDPAAVDRVSFEYSSVTINRPWFVPEVFSSRAWRFYEEGRILSDGHRPPSGQCTAYVSGLVLARNIRITRPAAATGPINLAFLTLERPAAAAVIITRPQPASVVIARADARASAVAEARNRAAASRSSRVEPPGASPMVTMRQPLAGSRVAMVAPADRDMSRVIRPVETARGIEAAVPRPAVAPRNLSTLSIPGIRWPLQKPPVRPEPENTAPPPMDDANLIYVLAFVCRLLPRAPDPDPALKW